MENAARVIITVFFIGLIALAIVLFGIFGILPLGQAGKILKGKNVTSTPEQQIEGDIILGEDGTIISVNPGIQVIGGQQTGNQSGTALPFSTDPNININQNAGGFIEPNIPIQPVKRIIRLDAPAGSPDAPQQSTPISESQIPLSAVKLTSEENKILPSSFTVQEGKEVTISFSSKDGKTHLLSFDDESVQGIAIGIGPKETRTISFIAPAAGSYDFRCDVPGHASMGETGKMYVVK